MKKSSRIRSSLPRWLLEQRTEAEELAELYQAAVRLSPENFASRETDLVRALLYRARRLTGALEYASGIHAQTLESENVVAFRLPERMPRCAPKANISGRDPPPRAR